MTPCLLALDQGTTSARALLFDCNGQLLGLAQQEFTQHFPQTGWVEHDAEELWATQLEVTRRVIAETHTDPRHIIALGITNQRETTVLWERASGRPLAHAIVWQDRRTAPLCDELRAAGLEPLFQQKTGLLLDPYFSGSKLKWLLDHLPDARARARRGELAFGTIDSWLLWKLTNGRQHRTDASNAARTLLYNLHSGDWDDELLQLLDIPRELLPEIHPSSSHYGDTEAHLLGAALPICALIGDQQAATFGQACLHPGMAKNTYGTGCFMLLNTGSQIVPSPHRLLTTVAWQLPEATTYALEGSVFMAGAIVQWLRDGLGILNQASDIEALAASVPDNGGVTLVPAFTGLGAPHWQPHARACLLGMSRGTTRAHIARAALEAIALQSTDVLKAMQQDAALPITELRVDGGAARNDLLMQCQADLLGIPVVRPKHTEATALGAAFLAGRHCGLWTSEDDIASLWQADRRFEPQLDAHQRDRLLNQWNDALRLVLTTSPAPLP